MLADMGIGATGERPVPNVSGTVPRCWEDGGVVDCGGIEELISAHHLRLVRLAYVLCGDAAEAEDLVAGAYAKAWPRIRRGGVDDPAAYLRRAVVNASASWKRHRFVVRREEQYRRPEVAQRDLSEEIWRRELLATAMAKLPSAQRQVVALRYLEDLSEAEAASLLGVPPGTVKSRLARALVALRTDLVFLEDGHE